MYNRLSLSLVVLFLCSCGAGEKPADANTAEPDTAALAIPAEEQKTGPVMAPDYTRFFKGSINGKHEFMMMLVNTDGELEGSYRYLDQKEYLRLEGKQDETGNLVVEEFNTKGQATGAFRGQLNENSFSGEWSTPEDEYDRARVFSFRAEAIGRHEYFHGAGIDTSQLSFKTEPNRTTEGYYNVISWPQFPQLAKNMNRAIEWHERLYELKHFFFRNYMQVTTVWDGEKFLETVHTLFDLRTGLPVSGLELIRPEKRKELLNRIAQKVYEIHEHSNKCFERPVSVEWKDIEIILHPLEIEFEYTFGSMTACRSDENGSFILGLEEAEEFLETE